MLAQSHGTKPYGSCFPQRTTSLAQRRPHRVSSIQAPKETTAPAVTIRIGSRGSKLARLQAEQVQLLLRKVRPEWGPDTFTTVTLTTHGDRETEGELRKLGQGAFTEVIDRAVAAGDIDIGVHSLKDSPVNLPDGVKLAACLPRDDARDAFISLKATSLGELPPGARVGTSSLRRKAQLLHAYPHLTVVPVRGNVDHRLQMLHRGELDAIVLAAAGLSRLGQQALITRVLDFHEMLPAACQGAIGVTCSATDPFLAWELALTCHEPTRLEVAAERALLAALLNPPAQDKDKDQKNGNGDLPAEADAGQPQQQEQPTQQPDEAAGQDSTPGPSTGPVAAAYPVTAPSPQGISSITGLPLLPSFAVACHAGFDPHEGVLRLEGLVASEDGRVLHRLTASGGAGSPAEAEAIGASMGRQLREFAVQEEWMDE